MEPNRDKEEDKQSKPGIARPGQPGAPDQEQQPQAPPQPDSRHPSSQSSSLWIPPRTGNPDLDPIGQSPRVDLRERNPLTPQGMLFDPRQLIDHQFGSRPDPGYPTPDHLPPPGVRYDPYGPPDPNEVMPGRGPMPSHRYGVPDPDELPPPGMHPQSSNLPGGKGLKYPWPPGPRRGGPPSGPGGSPFL